MKIPDSVLWDNNPTDLPDDPAFEEEAQELTFELMRSLGETSPDHPSVKALGPEMAAKYLAWLTQDA